jgi:anti-sigma factor RsiW
MTQHCADQEMLVQAELDGELDVAATAALMSHVATCPGCADLRQRLASLQTRLRADITPETAPAALREFLRAQLKPRPILWKRPRVAFAAGLAVAASVALLLPRTPPDPLLDQAVALHIRALQPGHLLDVTASDQHVVKPWFDGRIDFAPNVKDLAAQGFPLLGGRLDYLARRPAAVLVYGRDRHMIDLFISKGPPLANAATQDGYNAIGWSEGDLSLLAVSDLNAADLQAFTNLYRATR